jgi:type IV pilus assembly protein PilM
MSSRGLLPRVSPGFLRVSTGPIGIDFGTERVNMVQIDGHGAEIRVRAVVSRNYGCSREHILADPERLRALMREALQSRPFRGNKVVASLPPSMVNLVVVNYHIGERDEVEAVVAAVTDRFGASLDRSIIDFIPINHRESDQNYRSALVAMAEKSVVTGFLENMRHCSLNVVSLEVGPVAIKRLIAVVNKSPEQGTIVAINFGTVKSFVTVISGESLVLDRDIDFGTQGVLQTLAEALDVDPAAAQGLLHKHGITTGPSLPHIASTGDLAASVGAAITEILKPAFVNLADEIRRLKNYIAAETRGRGIDTIYALGSLARWPGADKLLSNLSGVEVVSINPFYGLELGDNATTFDDLEPISGVAIATGLALKGQ